MRGTLVASAFFVSMAAAQSSTWHRLPVRSADTTSALAYDEARGRMVLFEGHEREPSRTWELVGDVWTLRDTSVQIGNRIGARLAWDAARRRVVLFGGERPLFVRLGDAWEWDGQTWSPLPGLWVTSYSSTGFGFDPASGRCLARIEGSGSPPGTYLLEPNGWRQFATNGPQLGTFGWATAADAVRQRLTWFTCDMAFGARTWEWDGTAWAQLASAPGAQPTPRQGFAMCFVPGRNRVLLSGGINVTYATLDDLWEWDGVAWAAAGRTGLPRSFHAMAHDAGRGVTVFAGGRRDTSLEPDTWDWDGTRWRGLDSPAAGRVYAAVQDTARGRLVAFEPDLVREWDGARWHVSPANMVGSPAYDEVRARTLLNGWQLQEWDGTAWTVHPSPGPGALVYDASRGRAVLFESATRTLHAWNGVTWTVLPANGVPPPSQCTMAYDRARSRLVACSWTVDPLLNATSFNTHEWDGAAWQRAVGGAQPPLRYGFSLAYDVSRNAVLLHGGQFNRYVLYDDLWRWSGVNWTQVWVMNAPAARMGSVLASDLAGSRLWLIGGEHWEPWRTWFGDVWFLDASPSFASASLGAGCGGLASTPALAHGVPHPGASAFTIDLLRAPPSAPALFALGFASGSVPLGGGCTLFVPNAAALLFAPANAAGFATVRMPIPASTLGLSFTAQAAALDATAPLGVALTEGLRLTVGF